MEAALRSIIENALGEYIWLDRIEAKLPLTLRNLKLREKNIQEVLDEDGNFPFDITNGNIGSISVNPGWMGTVEITVTDILLNLSFSPMKAMRAAMGGNADSDSGSEDEASNTARTAPTTARRAAGGPPRPKQHPQGTPWAKARHMLAQPPANVPPRYCARHRNSDQRSKVEPRFMECTKCRVRLQTNYAEFMLCPACSDKEQRCMLCGLAAPHAGAYVPSGAPLPCGAPPCGAPPCGAPPCGARCGSPPCGSPPCSAPPCGAALGRPHSGPWMSCPPVPDAPDRPPPPPRPRSEMQGLGAGAPLPPPPPRRSVAEPRRSTGPASARDAPGELLPPPPPRTDGLRRPGPEARALASSGSLRTPMEPGPCRRDSASWHAPQGSPGSWGRPRAASATDGPGPPPSWPSGARNA